MYVFRLSLLSGFTVLGNQKSLTDYFSISLIPFSYSYLLLPEALTSFFFFQLRVFVNAVYIITPMPTVLADIHDTGRLKGCQKCLLIKKVMPITFIIQSSLFSPVEGFSVLLRVFKMGWCNETEISVSSPLHSISELLQTLSSTMNTCCPAPGKTCTKGLHLVIFAF